MSRRRGKRKRQPPAFCSGCSRHRPTRWVLLDAASGARRPWCADCEADWHLITRERPPSSVSDLS